MLRGTKHTQDSLRKMRFASLGKTSSPETRKRISQTKRGQLKSEATKLRMSAAQKKYHADHPRSPETCRKISEAHKGLVAWNKGKRLSAEHRAKLSLAKKGKPQLTRRGEMSHKWKGGLTNENKAIRMSLQYKIWRKHVFERDNYTCQACGERGGDIRADHELPFAFYPDLRFEILNGRTLCDSCHRKTPTYGLNINFYDTR